MPGVVARFFVQHIDLPPEGSSQGTAVNLSAVCRGAANSEWASATPAGNIRMVIRNDLASQQFERGKEYEVTFREVETPKFGDGHAVQAVHLYGGKTWACGVCGIYAQGQDYNPDAEETDPTTLDWSGHDVHFAKVQ